MACLAQEPEQDYRVADEKPLGADVFETTGGWRVEIDTEHPDVTGREVDPSVPFTLTGRSLMLLHGTQAAS